MPPSHSCILHYVTLMTLCDLAYRLIHRDADRIMHRDASVIALATAASLTDRCSAVREEPPFRMSGYKRHMQMIFGKLCSCGRYHHLLSVTLSMPLTLHCHVKNL